MHFTYGRYSIGASGLLWKASCSPSLWAAPVTSELFNCQWEWPQTYAVYWNKYVYNMYRYHIIYIMYNHICRSIRRIFTHLKKLKTEARSSAVRNQGDAFRVQSLRHCQMLHCSCRPKKNGSFHDPVKNNKLPWMWLSWVQARSWLKLRNLYYTLKDTENLGIRSMTWGHWTPT